ncbi:putative Cation transport ATPase [Thiomonas sp. X19]|nr:putative Cation transport ATPase [Thiomonas sp. X19]
MPTPSSSDAKQTTARPPRSETSVLAKFALVLPIIYIALCLIGFGVSLAVESHLGIPHSSLYKGQIDLIDLSSIGMFYLLSLIGKIAFNLNNHLFTFFGYLLFQPWHSNWLEAVSIALVIGLAAFFVLTVFFHKQQQAAADSNKPWRGQRRWEQITARLPKAKATLRGKGWRAMLAIAIGVLTPPLFVLLLAIAMIVVAFALSTPVFIGIVSGTALICQDTHGAAIGCSPMVRTAKTSTPASPAQQIITVHLKDGKDIAGVYLLSTPSAVLIFQPQTRQAMAIVTESIADMSFKLAPLSR